MESPESPIRIHLFGVASDEADASIESHGYPDKCDHKGCTSELAAMAMFRCDPLIGWGSINAMGMCEVRETELLQMSIDCGESVKEE